MTDRPILFSAPMARALLDGRKTQTRRVLRVPKWALVDEAHEIEFDDDGTPLAIAHETGCFASLPVPFAVGDRLWARETFSFIGGDGVFELSQARMTGRYTPLYRSDEGATADRWWPGIHMPREFSRLTLTVTTVRVQQLQEINHADAKAEGVHPPCPHRAPQGGGCDGDPSGFDDCYRCAFRLLWMRINGERANWYANPWIVALTFTVEARNIDAPVYAPGDRARRG